MTWRRERRQRGVSTAGQAASDSEPTFFEAVAQVQAEAFEVFTSPFNSFVVHRVRSAAPPGFCKVYCHTYLVYELQRIIQREI
jgi:hypothetical protein